MNVHPRSGPRAGAWLTLFLCNTALWLGATAGAIAQNPDSTRPMYGVPDSEFLRAIWITMQAPEYSTDDTGKVTHNASPADNLWDYARSIGVNTLRINAWDPNRLIPILNQVTSDTQRVIVSNPEGPMSEVGLSSYAFSDVARSQNVEFYPFDSTRFRSWDSRFLHTDGGVVDTNVVEKNEFGTAAGERVISTDNGDTADQLIASQLAYDYEPWQEHRFKVEPDTVYHDSVVQNSAWPLLYRRGAYSDSTPDWWIAVKGHMFDTVGGTSADTNDAILHIEVWQEVPKGAFYRVDGEDAQADDNFERLVHSFDVLKRDLDPTEPEDYDTYQESSFSIPIGEFLSNVPDSANTRRFDFRVYWTGAERVALRSISFRDHVAELMLGRTQASDDFRDLIAENLRAYLIDDMGTPDSLPDDTLRTSIIGVAAGGEYFPSEIDCAAAFNKLMKERFGNSGTLWQRMPGYGEDGGILNLHHIDPLQEVYTKNVDVVRDRDADVSGYLSNIFNCATGVPPVIEEHNGGRFSLTVGDTLRRKGIPLLNLPANNMVVARSNIEAYETTLQRIGYGGQYVPSSQSIGEPMVPVSRRPYPGAGQSLLTSLGRMAEDASERHRRLLVVLFNTTHFGFERLTVAGTHYVDTNIWGFAEASHLRALAAFGVVYGMKGLVHQVANSKTNTLAYDSGGGNYVGYDDSWGVSGPGTRDTARNRFDSSMGVYAWLDNGTSYYDTAGGFRHKIRNFYVGWSNRTAETRRINEWLKRLGPYLMPLRWRTAYSIHFTVPQKYVIHYEGHVDSLGTRPIASTEPIIDVRTRDPRSTTPSPWTDEYLLGGMFSSALPYAPGFDSLHKTYVELGFFHDKIGSNPSTQQVDHTYDTTHVAVLNRRSFERPIDVHADSARGILMDSLAEIREVWMKLNMATWPQHTFVRIRELAADSLVVPGRITRRALDTICHATAWFKLNLGPGRAALLRITHLPPDTSIQTGSVAHSNQRKIVFDGARYHAVYMRLPAETVPDTLRPDTIFYRRSLYVSDATGSILWEPKLAGTQAELPISVVPTDTLWANRYPSLTLRTLYNPTTSQYDTVVTIVWSCHSWAHATGLMKQHLALRNVKSNGAAPAQMQDSIEWPILRYDGYYKSEYGTPVISRAATGEFIAWSDSTLGIVARFRRYGTGANWWNNNTAVYSDTVYLGWPGSSFPSVPTFNHIANADNETGIVWQQQASIPPGLNAIRYARLYYDSAKGGQGGHWIRSGNFGNVSVSTGMHTHPSLDQHQDRWGRIQDCATWESLSLEQLAGDQYERRSGIQSRSVYTYPNRGASEFWGWAQLKLNIIDTVVISAPVTKNSADMHPNISCLNQYFDSTQQNPATSTIAFNARVPGEDWYMLETTVAWADIQFRYPRFYMSGGRFLSGSAATVPQQTRHAVLYSRSGDTLRTTREYFMPRVRPIGYLAQGRQTIMRLNDSASLIIGIDDPWYANDDGGEPMTYALRDAPDIMIHSLSTVELLMSTVKFETSDSTRIGCRPYATLFGDTTGLWKMRVTAVVELMDSATNVAVHRLDSFDIRSTSRGHANNVDTTFDLLSGRYWIRMRFDTASISLDIDSIESTYPVADVAMIISDTSLLGKLRRTGIESEVSVRISAQPNPTNMSTEIRFSIPERDYTSILVYDKFGKTVATVMKRTLIDQGRYAIDLNTLDLAPGAYLIELRTTEHRVIEKIVVMR